MYMENLVVTVSLVCEAQILRVSIFLSLQVRSEDHCKPTTKSSREGYIYIYIHKNFSRW